MTDYNISSFIRLMQAGFVRNSTQTDAGAFLLASVEIDEDISIDARMISNLVNQKSDVHEDIKKASANPDVINKVIDYFNESVLSDLSLHVEEDTYQKMIDLLDKDSSVPIQKQEELMTIYHDGETAEFLAMCFLYAVNRPNKQIETYTEIADVSLLYEVNNKCPLCQNTLVKTVKGKSVQTYEITQIYSEKKEVPTSKLKSYSNKIALCKNCASVHHTFNAEFSDDLFNLKGEYEKQASFQEKIENVSLEDEITDVIFRLVNVGPEIEQEEFKLDVVKLDKKIYPENTFLLSNLKDHVLRYYYFIQDMLSKANIFEDIALAIKKAYRKIHKIYSDQDDVVYHLADWIFNKTNLYKPAHRRACDIIVAFFVQNCEVFDEIAK